MRHRWSWSGRCPRRYGRDRLAPRHARGFSEGCPMSILFAATYPERVSHLVLFGGFARAADLRPSGETADAARARRALMVKNWGNGNVVRRVYRDLAADPNIDPDACKIRTAFKQPWRNKDPSGAEQSDRCHPPFADRAGSDAGAASQDRCCGAGYARSQPGPAHPGRGVYIEYPEGDHGFSSGETDALLGDIEEFVTGDRDDLDGA